MHLYKTMRNFLIDFDYYIDVYKNNIHVFGYVDILRLTSEEILLLMPSFKLKLTGNRFVVKALEKREILIEGEILEAGFVR